MNRAIAYPLRGLAVFVSAVIALFVLGLMVRFLVFAPLGLWPYPIIDSPGQVFGSRELEVTLFVIDMTCALIGGVGSWYFWARKIGAKSSSPDVHS